MQHGFDPLPPFNKPAEDRLHQNTEQLKRALMGQLRFRELETGQRTDQETINRVASPPSALDFMLHNFTIIKKSKFSALSGIYVKTASTFSLST
jgi:hypothetical protein